MKRNSRPTVHSSITSLSNLCFAGLGLSLGLIVSCDEPAPDAPVSDAPVSDAPAPDAKPVCSFHAEVEIAGEEFLREPGNPWKHRTLGVTEGDYVLEFHIENLPAAEVILDGDKLNLSAGLSVKDVVVHRVELHLTEGTHELAIRVAGPPGGKIRYTLAQVIASDQPAIVDQFTVHQGESSTHTVCGGLSHISFGDDALQPADVALEVTASCEAAACVEGEDLASPRLVFTTANNGYQFRTAPVLEHPAAGNSVRELDGVPIAGETVGTVVLDGAEARIVRSRIPHFSTVEDRDLGPWCEQQLEQLNAPASYLCYSSGEEPGMQYLALCELDNGTAIASEVSPCGLGPNACLLGDNANDVCNPVGVDCEVRALGALEIEPCPPLAGDSFGSPSHSLRCQEFTNQVFVGEPNSETGECELRGNALLTRHQQVKTVLAATYGARFEEAINWYMTENAECANYDFAAEFVDYASWDDLWSTNILKFAICVDVLRGRGEPGNRTIDPEDWVLEAEMAAMLVRAGGVGSLGLPDNTQLEPHPRVVALNLHHALLNDMAPALVEFVNQECFADAWFFIDPVVQAVLDEGVVCDINAQGSMTREDTAQWLYNLTTDAVSCGQAQVSCQTESGYPGKQACETCNSVDSCQTLSDSIVSMFPDYAARDMKITFNAVEGSDFWCERSGNTINCNKDIVANGKITNKLLFHELNHALKEARIEEGVSASICSEGSCSSGEFQASLLEAYYFPGPESECGGGNYKFTDSNNEVRAVAALGEAIQQSPVIPEGVLWSYAMGRNDTLVPYLERFGVTETADLYHSQTYK